MSAASADAAVESKAKQPQQQPQQKQKQQPAPAAAAAAPFPLDFVDICPAASNANKNSALELHLRRSDSELALLADALQGGITAFRGLPLDALKQYIGVVTRANELVSENLENLFNAKKEEFCITAMYAPAFVDRGVRLGLLPMTIRMHSSLPEFLALKLHKQRCIVRISKEAPPTVPHGIKKKAKKFALVVDGGLWPVCIDALTKQHERVHGHSWLNEYLDRCFYAMNVTACSKNANRETTGLHCISVVHANMVGTLAAARERVRKACDAKAEFETASASSSPANKQEHARQQIELDVALAQAQDEFATIAKEAFCAGEIGCTSGAIYTSLTGCHTVSGAGSVQLGVLAALLVQAGFKVWDLGMAMEYKTQELGGIEIRRNQWVAMAKEVGGQQPGRALRELDGYAVRVDCLLNAVSKQQEEAAKKD